MKEGGKGVGEEAVGVWDYVGEGCGRSLEVLVDAPCWRR